ncbi:MAG: hypothetical protein WKG07_39905 [Hymenobacter sp.]
MFDAEDKNAGGLTRRSFLAHTAATLAGLPREHRQRLEQRQQVSNLRREPTDSLTASGLTDRTFRNKRFYSVNGVLTAEEARSELMPSLTWRAKYVVPPFGEAHNHNVEDSVGINELVRKYLQDGIFYVKNPNNLSAARTSLLGKINIPTSIDVAFANGGLTASGGHPLGVV